MEAVFIEPPWSSLKDSSQTEMQLNHTAPVHMTLSITLCLPVYVHVSEGWHIRSHQCTWVDGNNVSSKRNELAGLLVWTSGASQW